MATTSTIDYTALTAPVTPAELAAFKTSEKLKPGYSSASMVSQVLSLIFIVAFLGFVVLIVLGTVTTIAVSAVREGSTLGFTALIVPLVVLAIMALGIFAILRSAFKGGNSWVRWYHLDKFAQANGLIFSRADPNPQYPGSIFGQGDSRVVTEHLRSATDRFLDYGNYSYSTGSGKSRTTHNWGFLALQIDRSLPNMVLDSKANNGLFGSTNLPALFAKNQQLHLEGDFDKHFTLYCPKEYESDALYIFTPDLMALLIDEASPFDVEIVDKWLFIYSSTVFDLRQPTLHQRLFRIVDTVGAKTLTQTDRYTDDRVQDFSANVVAPDGRRLKRGISVGTIVFAAVFIAIWAMPWIAGIFSSSGQ